MKSISGNASYIVNVSLQYIVNVSLIVHVNNEEELIVTRYKCWRLVVRATRSLSKRYWESRITSWRTLFSTGSLTFFCNRSKHYRPNLTASWSPKWVNTSLHGWTCQVCLTYGSLITLEALPAQLLNHELRYRQNPTLENCKQTDSTIVKAVFSVALVKKIKSLLILLKCSTSWKCKTKWR